MLAPKPPPGIATPQTAAELKTALQTLYSGAEWQGIEFICLDCSRRREPAFKRPRHKPGDTSSREMPRFLPADWNGKVCEKCARTSVGSTLPLRLTPKSLILKEILVGTPGFEPGTP